MMARFAVRVSVAVQAVPEQVGLERRRHQGVIGLCAGCTVSHAGTRTGGGKREEGRGTRGRENK